MTDVLDLGIDESIPFSLRGTLEELYREARTEADENLARLRDTEARLLDAYDALDAEEVYCRPRRELERKIGEVRAAITWLSRGEYRTRVKRRFAPYIARFKDLDEKEKQKKKKEAEIAASAETRYLPQVPCSEECMPDGAAKVSSGTLAAFTSDGDENFASAIAQEAKYAFGKEKRPAELIPFDMCPKCHVALRHNQKMQQLVCPNPSCKHWKRFADMTSSALAYGEEIEFCKYTYRPVTHLDDTMKFAEGAEAYVVPPEDMEKVIKELRRRRYKPEQLTIPIVRDIVDNIRGMKIENSVQVYSRLTGRAPRRMQAFMKDQMRIMFNIQEVPYRRHCKDRINNLSFPYTLYKYCELLGYWEMLESLPLLRGPTNRAVHDSIYSKVCADLDWQYIPTVQGPT